MVLAAERGMPSFLQPDVQSTSCRVLIASILLHLAISVDQLLQIVLRNLFDGGILWADSFLRILVLWVTMLGAMVATREVSHIKIDLLARYLPRNLALISIALASLFAAAVCGITGWYLIELVGYEYEDGTIAFGVVPTWVCQIIMPVGFGIMALRFLYRSFYAFYEQAD